MIAYFLFALAAVGQPDMSDAFEADISCVTAQIVAEDRQALLAEVASGRQGRVRQAFRAAAEHCARDRSWPADYSADIGQLAAVQIFIAAAGERLAQVGIRVALIDEWWAASPLPRDAENAEIEAALDSLHARLIAAGLDRSVLEANAALIGQYVGVLNVARNVRSFLALR